MESVQVVDAVPSTRTRRPRPSWVGESGMAVNPAKRRLSASISTMMSGVAVLPAAVIARMRRS